MAIKASKPSSSQGVSPAIIAIAVVLLLVFVGWFGYVSLSPKTEPLKPTGGPSELDTWITQKAKESGGDISKLSAEDQARLQKETRGMGAMALKAMLNK